MSAFAIPPMLVQFEDGTKVRIVPRPKDLVRAEIAGHDFQTGKGMTGMYYVAMATLGRMGRAGDLPAGLVIPESLDDFLDLADVEPETEDDPMGEDDAPDLSSTSSPSSS